MDKDKQWLHVKTNQTMLLFMENYFQIRIKIVTVKKRSNCRKKKQKAKHIQNKSMTNDQSTPWPLKHIIAALHPDVQDRPLATVTPSYSPLTCAAMASRF